MMSPIESRYCEALAEIRTRPYAPELAHLFREFRDVELSMFRVITDQPAREWRAMLKNALWWSGAQLSEAEQADLCAIVTPFLEALCPCV